MISTLEFKLGDLSSLNSSSLSLRFGSSSLSLVPMEMTVLGWNSFFLLLCVVFWSAFGGRFPSLKDLKRVRFSMYSAMYSAFCLLGWRDDVVSPYMLNQELILTLFLCHLYYSHVYQSRKALFDLQKANIHSLFH